MSVVIVVLVTDVSILSIEKYTGWYISTVLLPLFFFEKCIAKYSTALRVLKNS